MQETSIGAQERSCFATTGYDSGIRAIEHASVRYIAERFYLFYGISDFFYDFSLTFRESVV